MPGNVLDCGQVRARLEAFLEGADRAPDLTTHLAACEACLEACLEAALRRPPAEIAVSVAFAARTLSAAGVEQRRLRQRSLLPYSVAAACLLLVALGWRFFLSGGAERLLALASPEASPLTQLAVALPALGVEALACFYWLWRVART